MSRSSRADVTAHQQRMPRRVQLERAVGARCPARRRSTICENRARACMHVELGRDLDRPLAVVRPAAEGVGQREQDAADLLGLLLLERDDVVVDLDGARAARGTGSRRSPTRRARCPGIAAAMLGPHHQHVAAVALGDDLLLQILRRVLAAQVRLERRAQLRAAVGAAARECSRARGSRCRRPRPTDRSSADVARSRP